jgi:hypothetical protein
MSGKLCVLVMALLSVTVACDAAKDRNDWAMGLRSDFDNANIYASGDDNTTLVAELDCNRMFSWPQVGGLNNRGFRSLQCRTWGEMKTYDLSKGLPKGTAGPGPQDSKPDTVEHGMGCPVAAARLIKKMRKCGLETAGITEEALCSKSSKIDSRAVRMISNSDDCAQLKAYLSIQ